MNYLKVKDIPVLLTWIRKLSIMSRSNKLKKGVIENWKHYWITLGKDYKEAVMDIIKDSKERPVKAFIYMTGLLGLGYIIKENPDDLEYENRLLYSMNESALLGSSIRNSITDEHFKYVVSCYNQGLVRRINFGIGSILWIANQHRECAGYEATTSYLNPQLRSFHERIIDVGFCGEWWNLRRKFLEFDVSAEEWLENEKIS